MVEKTETKCFTYTDNKDFTKKSLPFDATAAEYTTGYQSVMKKISEVPN